MTHLASYILQNVIVVIVNLWLKQKKLYAVSPLTLKMLSIKILYSVPGTVLESEEIKTSISEVNCRLQWYMQRRLALFTEEECRFQLMQNNNYRHHAYRSYISYINGLLGRGVRKVIPSCVVLEIRKRWPDPNGLYRGHVSANELDDVFD